MDAAEASALIAAALLSVLLFPLAGLRCCAAPRRAGPAPAQSG